MLDDIIDKEGVETREGTEKGRPRARNPPRILYHGSCLTYLARSGEKYGRIKDKIYLTGYHGEALGYALKRARQYQDIATVVIVDTFKISNPSIFELDGAYWAAHSLTPDCFSLVIGDWYYKKADWQDWERRIANNQKELIHLSKEQLLCRNQGCFKYHDA